LKYYIYIAILIGCIYSRAPVDSNFTLSLSASNMVYAMVEDTDSGHHMALSVAYIREDSEP